MKTRTRHSQKRLGQPLLLLRQTPVWVVLALEQTLLLNRHLLNAQLWTVP